MASRPLQRLSVPPPAGPPRATRQSTPMSMTRPVRSPYSWVRRSFSLQDLLETLGEGLCGGFRNFLVFCRGLCRGESAEQIQAGWRTADKQALLLVTDNIQ